MPAGCSYNEVVYNNGIAVDYRICEINAAYEKILGLARAGITGKLASEVYSSEKIPFLEIYSKVAETGVPQTFEAYFEPAKKFLHIDACSPEKGAFSTAVSDISTRKHVEILSKSVLSALQSSELKQKAMISNISDVIGIIDSNGIVKYKSDNIEKWFGWKPQELVGGNAFVMVHPDDMERLQKEFLGLLENDGTIKTFEFRYKCKAENYEWVELTAINMIKDPVINGILINYHVITRRKLAEQALLESEDRLRRSEKMEAIGQLAGGIAHDFNNVLGGIIGYTDMSLDFAEKGSALESYLGKVLTASERAKNLIRQILTFSRQSNHRKSLIAVGPVVQEVLELLNASIPSSVHIDAQLAKDTKPVFADPTTIQEVLLNLATNAVYAMKNKGVLTIALYHTKLDKEECCRIGKLAAGEYTVLEVRDTGCGMDAQTLEKAFEPFFTTKPVGDGTGMGLSVVFGIVHSHGGDLQVETALGKGTAFRIFLPVSPDSVLENADNDTAACRGNFERILFVDDETMLVEMAQKMLTQLGYSVIGMSSSVDALQFIKENPRGIDVLITDQTMPDLTGVELAKAALKIRKDLPIVLCTGYSSEINPDRAFALGIGKMMLKPIHRGQFAQTLSALLYRKKENGSGENTGNRR